MSKGRDSTAATSGGSRSGAWLRRRNKVLEIRGFHVGDIKSERTVKIVVQAAMAGTISAPKLVVSGILYGTVLVREVIVEDGGQIWGDVHAASIILEPRGKLHGWVSTLDEGTVELMRSGELSLKDLPSSDQLALLPEQNAELEALGIDSADLVGMNPVRLAIWRQLQGEAASARLARAEIELAFEARIQEAVNQLPTPGHVLRGELEQLEGQTAELKGQVAEAALNHARLQSEIASNEAALHEMRQIAEKRRIQLETIKRTADARILELEAELSKTRQLQE